MNQNQINLILTGGTIDSYYDIDKCTIVPHEKSVLLQFLKKYAGVEQGEMAVTEICMKDSRDIAVEDIEKVADSIRQSPNKKHIVTHGTFTMFSSARYLQELLPDNHEEVIIFTGSMFPLEGFSPNDAGFNLGSAMIAARCLDAGVYIAFNGKIHQPEDIKNLH